MRLFVKVGLILVFCFYLLLLVKQVLFKYPDAVSHFTLSYHGPYDDRHNFIPFKTIIYYLFLADINFNIRVDNLFGNVMGFFPFGFVLPLLSKRFLRMNKVAAATFGLSLTFELLQLIFKIGSFDVDDLILNTLGGLLGYLSIHLARSLIKDKWGKQKDTSI